ncbi:hypothetical protein Cni_G25731 [Canna indica]|uniref:Uncharacterized protein n=1 Tax=Canna indica TaxID=4628 RepID=A0AAQ3L1N3_9LILI|nr:hypothetical protein Cni_G25731 [Canna indica]
MGNCQAADVATTVIQHADGRLETGYWPLSASQVMAANPGHYVAAIVTVPHPRSSDHRSSSSRSGGKLVRYLKLLRPEDALLAGHFYRLVSFEDVLREFGTKRRVRLSKLLAKKELRKQREEEGKAEADSSATFPLMTSVEDEMQQQQEEEEEDGGDSDSNCIIVKRSRHGQWRPSLQTIAEAGSFKQSTLSV